MFTSFVRGRLVSRTLPGTRVLFPTSHCFATSYRDYVTSPPDKSDKALSTKKKDDVSMDSVWSLWNEGNLFSMSVDDLRSFLKSQGQTDIDEDKKTTLVRKVEELMSKEQPSLVRADEATVSLFEEKPKASQGDLYEEADLYGDWGVEPGFNDKKDVFELSLDAQALEPQSALDVRAFQILHGNTTADVRLVKLDTSKLPGTLKGAEAFTLQHAITQSANKERFIHAFTWAITNFWNLGHEGDINVTYGRAMLTQGVRTFRRKVLPLWTIQKTLIQPRTYRFLSIAHELNTPGVTRFLKSHGFRADSEPTTTYLVSIRRTQDPMVLELNEELQPTNVLRAWDRHLVTQVIRSQMPDIRFMVRGRVPLKKRVATPYFESQILKFSRDTVDSVLPKSLGDVTYVAERVSTSWVKKCPITGVGIKVVQIKRTPVLTTMASDQGERLEYEISVALPGASQRDNVDVTALAGEVFDTSYEFAESLEDGMVALKSFPMKEVEDEAELK